MKNLKQYINESLRIGIDDDPYQYHPDTWDELRQIIVDRYEEQGPGTERAPIDFTDIDVSGMTSLYSESSNQGIFAVTHYEYIDISDWNVSRVKNMSFMFHHCTNLKSVGDISNWDVSRVENMFSMFEACENLKSIDISNWDTSSVKNMGFMFADCGKLESIGDLSNWNISSVRNTSYMFFICKNLKSIGNLNGWNISSIKIKDVENMFDGAAITNKPDWYEE